jgi:hypothetical protein
MVALFVGFQSGLVDHEYIAEKLLQVAMDGETRLGALEAVARRALHEFLQRKSA